MHMAQLMPLLLTVSCFSKIQIGFTFLVPAHPGSPGKSAIKRVCVFIIYHLPSFSGITSMGQRGAVAPGKGVQNSIAKIFCD